MNVNLEACFVCKNLITLHTSLWVQVSNIIVTGYQLNAATAFALLAFVPSVVCYPDNCCPLPKNKCLTQT